MIFSVAISLCSSIRQSSMTLSTEHDISSKAAGLPLVTHHGYIGQKKWIVAK